MKVSSFVRHEPWGKILYDRAADEFSAEIRSGAVPLPGAPIGIGWIIVGACNLKCLHCYGNAEELPRTVLSTADCMNIIDRIVESGVMRVVISGGEPMLRPDIFDIIEGLSTKNVSVVLGTNGAFIEADSVERLSACTRVEISLDAATPEKNNRIRPSRQKHGNAWLETMRAIEICLQAGVKLRILTAVNSWNQHDLAEMAALLSYEGVTDWAISWTIPAGRARANFDRMRPLASIVEMNLAAARRSSPSLTIRYSHRVADQSRFYCLILPDGQMAAEDLSLARKIPLGRLPDQPISKIWTAENYDLLGHFRKWIGKRVVSI